MKLVLDDGKEIAIEDFKVIDIQIGDVICLETINDVDFAQQQHIKSHFAKIFGDDIPVLILKKGHLSIVRKIGAAHR